MQGKDVASIMDERPLGRMQIKLFVVCSLVVFFDGFDTQSIGYVAPLLASATNAPIASFGTVFSVGLAGAALGAFLFGPLGDQFGRRWLLIVACVFFSVFSLTTVFVTSLNELMFVRFLTGLGLGGAVPTSLALVSEYSPTKYKALAITAMFSAFPFGGFIGGLAASFLILHYGWQSVFLLGGIAPALACVALVLWVPESIQYLAVRGKKRQLDRILRKFAPDVDSVRIEAPMETGRSQPVIRQMLAAEQLRITLLLWVPFFLGFMVILTVVLWGPSLLRESGVPLSIAALVFSVHYLGGFIGTAFSGYLIDKAGAKKVLIPGFLIGAICVGSFGYLTWSPLALCLDAFLCGLLLVGASNGLLPVAAALYPTSLRSSGIGWAMGAGRCGQLVGPILVGGMLSAQLATSTIFLAAIVPCAISALFVWIVTRRMQGHLPAEPSFPDTASLRTADT